MSKSCYVLEISVPPGGARRGDLFAYNRMVHIRRCLEQELFSPDPAERAYAASLAAGQGETIALWVVEGGKLVKGLDLCPHVRVKVADDPPVALPQALARDAGWKDRLADGERVAFEIDWRAIAAEVPALRGEPLRPGEVMDLEVDEDALAPFDSYLEIVEEIGYGYEDLEDGSPAPPGFVDPDPPPPR